MGALQNAEVIPPQRVKGSFGERTGTVIHDAACTSTVLCWWAKDGLLCP